MSELRVLIVGASIAGPTAAYWFAKAGATVTVIERFPQLRSSGQNVDIRTVGVRIMRKMTGMEEAILAKIAPMEGISFVDTNGQSFGTIKPSGNPNQQSLVSEFEIFRGDLSKILYDMTKDNNSINYVFGEQVTAIHHAQEDGPVTVEFANGLPTSEFDLVVACDGATSRTRAIGLGCGVRDHIKPLNSWSAYYTIEQDLLEGGNIGKTHSSPGGRNIAIGPDPSGSNRVILMGVHPRSAPDLTRPLREALKEGDSALKQYLVRHFSGVGWKCDEAMKGLMEATDLYASEMIQVKTPTLHKGRFVLVGDAGYAPGPTGTGTSLAIAGAYVLAGEICKHRGDLGAGLRGYEENMRPLIEEMQKIPPLVPTIFAPQTSWGIWLRNMVFAFICWSGALEFTQRFIASAFSDSDQFCLSDYEWER